MLLTVVKVDQVFVHFLQLLLLMLMLGCLRSGALLAMDGGRAALKPITELHGV